MLRPTAHPAAHGLHELAANAAACNQHRTHGWKVLYAQPWRLRCARLPAIARSDVRVASAPCTKCNGDLSRAAAVRLLSVQLIAAACSGCALSASAVELKELKCRGLSAYNMQKCLREAREAGSETADGANGDDKLKYEQPGTLVTLPSGIQYRDILEGGGKAAAIGDKCSLRFIVYKLSSGAYFKYSSGGTPVLLYGLGYGFEGQNDVGETYDFILGDRLALPIAATLGLVDMREGAELVRVTRSNETGFDKSAYERVQLVRPYALPAPPKYGQAQGQAQGAT